MKVLRSLFTLLLIAGSAYAFYQYWEYRKSHPETDDAFLEAHIVRVSSRVTAPASAIHVVDNQFVHSGEPLFDLAPETYEAQLEKARAQLELAAQSTGAEGAGVRSASAALRERHVTADNARRTVNRLQALAQRKLVPTQQLDDGLAAYAAAEAAVGAAQAELDRARNALGETGPRNAQLRAAAAGVSLAELELSYTHVVAAAEGWVTNLTLRKGTMVTAGQTQFALIESAHWWVEANYRETDLTHIRPGQSARITFDMYPDRLYRGKVESVSAGSGATFSLLPPENATGNWVKVTQRFPVRIVLDDQAIDAQAPLRVGASATAEIHLDAPP